MDYQALRNSETDVLSVADHRIPANPAWSDLNLKKRHEDTRAQSYKSRESRKFKLPHLTNYQLPLTITCQTGTDYRSPTYNLLLTFKQVTHSDQ